MLLHVTNEPLDWSDPESKNVIRHETILGKCLSVKSDAFFMWISKRLQGGWDVQDDSGDE